MEETLSITKISEKTPLDIGDLGESLAYDHLLKNGYRLVASNFKAPVGRNSKGVQVTGEIDIIALDGETLVFVEVKTRRSDEFTPIISNVDIRKQRQITRTAKVYRRIFGVNDVPFRFDVVTVLLPHRSKPKITLVRDFWNESKFRNINTGFRTWDDFS